MKILFISYKGGVGKTTNCAQLANYLYSKNLKVSVIDTEGMLSSDRRYNLDNLPITTTTLNTWDIETIHLDQMDTLLHRLQVVPTDAYTLIDVTYCGKFEEIKPLLYSVDCIIFVHSYTSTFRLYPQSMANFYLPFLDLPFLFAKLFLLPNSATSITSPPSDLVSVERFHSFLSENNILLCPYIPNSRELRLPNTLALTEEVHSIVSPSYDYILNNLNQH